MVRSYISVHCWSVCKLSDEFQKCQKISDSICVGAWFLWPNLGSTTILLVWLTLVSLMCNLSNLPRLCFWIFKVYSKVVLLWTPGSLLTLLCKGALIAPPTPPPKVLASGAFQSDLMDPKYWHNSYIILRIGFS